MEEGELELELAGQAAAGDQEAFRVLMNRHSRMVFGLAYRITGDRNSAEDVVQETFMRAHRALDRFDGRARFGTWLHRIATNAAVDWTRQHKLRPEVSYEAATATVELAADREADPERRAASADLRRALGAAMAGLTPLERVAFVLRHYEGCSTAEIAERLGQRSGASRQAVFRAVAKLRQALSPLLEGQS